jgi:hypothetical protein
MIISRASVRIAMKILQSITSLFALCFTFFYTSDYECNEINIDMSYPFNFEILSIDWEKCNPQNYTINLDLINNTGTYAQLFAMISLMSFSYSLIFICLIIISLLKFKLMYEIITFKLFIMIIDFSISFILFISWFLCEHFWGNYFMGLKKSLKFGNLIKLILICKNESINCNIKSSNNFNSLNFSLICGFLNIILWFGDIVLILDNFYIVLETKWKFFKNKIKPTIINSSISDRRTVWKKTGVSKLVLNINRTLAVSEQSYN